MISIVANFSEKIPVLFFFLLLSPRPRFGLVEPCVCGQVQWGACSVMQVNWINLQVYIISLVETNYILVNDHSLSLIPTELS